VKEETTFGASAKGLANLLGIGMTGKSKAEADRVAGELLRARLAGTLPLDSVVIDALPAIIGRLGQELVPLSGKSLGEALLDPHTDSRTLTRIKAHGKKLAIRKDSDADHAAGVVIYYAAIASALLFRDEKITQHSFANLAYSFDLLLNKPWMPPELSRHFARARKLCKKEAKS
jgi:hypothetical protein